MDISKHYSGEELVKDVNPVNISKEDMLKVLTMFPMPKGVVKEDNKNEGKSN